jgi:esterase/lipase
MVARGRMVAVTLLLLVLLAGCGPAGPAPTAAPPTGTPIPPTATSAPPTPGPAPEATATPPIPFEEVRFTTQDGVDLAATLFGTGDVAVLLLHMGSSGATQTTWHPFARLIAERGYTALTLDFRGRGDSGGRLETNLLLYDARAAVEFLRARGYSRLVCMGASMGGTTCLRLALEVELEGVVVLASTMSNGTPTMVTESNLATLAIPKLFVYGARDSSMVVNDMEKMYKACSEPKELVVYSGQSAHGTALFATRDGDRLRQELLDFLEELP